MNIVQVLQSKKHLTLGRSVYMARVDSKRYFEHLSYDDPLLAGLLEKINELGLSAVLSANFSEHNIRLDESELFHANQLVEGANARDMQCSAAFTAEVCRVSSQMSLLYTALRQEGTLTTSVPLLDEFIKVFRKYIFST